MKKIYFTLCALILLSLSLFAQSGISDRLAKELSLSNEQIDKIGKIKSQYDLKRSDLLIQLSIKKLELKKLLLKEDEPERNVVKKAMEDIAMLDVEVKLSRYDMEKDILNVLDKTQKQEYKMIKIRALSKNKKPNQNIARDKNKKNEKKKTGEQKPK